MVTHDALPQVLSLADNPSVDETAYQLLPSQNDERDVLCRVAMQDQQAFATLYKRHAPRVLGYLACRLPSPDLIDEVLQDVMLVLWQRAVQVPPSVPLVAWLCGVARHKAQKALARAAAPPTTQAQLESTDYESPEAVALHREHVHTLAAALDTLPRCERIALELLAYQGYTPQEIATLMDAPVSTVRTWVSRARQRLRARIARLDHDL